MRRRPMLALLALPLLVACQLGAPGAGPTAPASGAPQEIGVTSLDAAAPQDGATAGDAAGAVDAAPDTAAATPKMSGADLAPAPGTLPAPDPAQPPAEPQPEPEVAVVAEPEAAPAVPEELKSPSQIACEKKGGSYARAGGSGSYVCVQRTRDGGKRCRKESDCEGLCLARSGTCAPITPIFGCQEIFQQDGLRVTECVE